MTYEELIGEIREIFGKADVSQIKEHIAYQFNIEGEAEGAFYVEVSEGELNIEPFEYYDRDVLFTTSANTLLEIAKGNMDAVIAFTVGKLKVEGNFDKALLLQQFSRDQKKEQKKAEKLEKKEKKEASDEKELDTIRSDSEPKTSELKESDEAVQLTLDIVEQTDLPTKEAEVKETAKTANAPIASHPTPPKKQAPPKKMAKTSKKSGKKTTR